MHIETLSMENTNNQLCLDLCISLTIDGDLNNENYMQCTLHTSGNTEVRLV